MRIKTRVWLFALLLAVAAVDIPGVSAQDDPCDFDGDGQVSPEEEEECMGGGEGDPAGYDECDLDGDGQTTPEEEEECYGSSNECDFDGDGETSPEEEEQCYAAFGECDTDGDGQVSPEEEEQCYGDDLCDFDGDGQVSPEEEEECFAGYDECDLDGDGETTDEELDECEGFAFDECDMDGDGTVSEEEEFECEEQFIMEECDSDSNGEVSEDEWDACEAAYDDVCDEDGDGEVSDDELDTCQASYSDDPCDFDGSGDIDDADEQECDYYYEDCDANGDDIVTPEEEQDCGIDGCWEDESGDVVCADGDEYYWEEDFDVCDFNEDGWVDEDEAYDPECDWFGDFDDCDLDGDGTVTDTEADECDFGYWDELDEDEQMFREAAKERRSAVKEAKSSGSLAAELKLGKEEVTLEQGGVGLTIDPTPEAEHGDANVVVRMEADGGEGKSFVFDLDYDAFDLPADAGAPTVEISHFIVVDGVRTETPITQASDLRDILNAGDDEGPEYWIVHDADGSHVMVSIDSWSIHEVAIKAIKAAASDAVKDAIGGEGSASPSGEGAPGLGLIGLLAAVGTVLAIRRR